MKDMDYNELLLKLDEIKARQQDDDDSVQALEETMDIVSDYVKVTSELRAMKIRYEIKLEAIQHKDNKDIYLCPNCGKRVPLKHSRCHWCGQAISWTTRR